MGAVRNVIMDLGGVMLEWDSDHLLARFEPDPASRAQLRASVFGADWKRFDRGEISEEQLIERLLPATGLPRQRLLEIVEAAREYLVEKPETVKLVRTLHQRGFNIYCLSNMPVPIYQHLRRRHNFWDLFSGIVVSGEIQLIKPEPEIYAHLLEKFALKPEESVFVDDLQVNIDAAKEAGLHGVCFLNATQCQQALEALLGVL